MKPDYVIHQGDCRPVLRTLPEKSVHMCVTSPPYWGLRRYEGVEPSVWGGHWLSCRLVDDPIWQDDGTCLGCRDCIGPNREYVGAWYGLLGLEPRIEMYVEHIVECFREVKRVLRDDGTLWLNLGDSYANAPKGNPGAKWHSSASQFESDGAYDKGDYKASGLKTKDLIGQPWRIAFALQADGWYLRSDIIWHKPNPMPESVTDRPTRAHEYLFLLTKKPKYYYDAEAVREKTLWAEDRRAGQGRISYDGKCVGVPGTGQAAFVSIPPAGRNKRSVWTIPTEANPEAHFASFPRKLVLPCVLAGTSEKGCCPECGTPWVRVLERDRQPTRPARDNKQDATGMANRDHERHVTDVKTLGWKPGCECVIEYSVPFGHSVRVEPDVVPCTVLDPFVGSGQAGIVATQQGRKFIGIDASAEYCKMARRRIANPEPEAEMPDAPGQMMLDELEPEVSEAVASRENVAETAGAQAPRRSLGAQA